MTPSARVQAAIEILDEVIASARDDGPPADAIVQRYFKTRRYAGSKDRRAVRELVYRAIRRSGDRPDSGRAAMLALPDTHEQFDGSPHGPAAMGDAELAVIPGLTRDPPSDGREEKADLRFRGDDGQIPAWLQSELSNLVSADERPALLERAPLDLRVNVARTSREAAAAEIQGAEPTQLSPWGLRLPPDTRIDDHELFEAGLIEVQDEGSQLIALAALGKVGDLVLDLCAGAGGKALAIAAASPGAGIIATDTSRQRLAQLAPRAERAEVVIETRLLDGGREADQLADLAGRCDVVLVDAPCSGSGTWRRNPEGRWRLTPERLDRVAAIQSRLLDLAAPLVKPGGTLVYATCSVLRREGAGQVEDFLGRHSSWAVQDVGFEGGRADGPGRLLTPGHDGTDGFFVARVGKPC